MATTETRRVRSAVLDAVGRDVGKPLAAIVGAATSLRGRNQSLTSTVQLALTETIRQEAGRLERFVAILLDMAKLECDAVELSTEIVALKAVAEAAVGDAADALERRNAEVILPPDLPPLRLDAAILRRVIQILVENAARQSPPSSTVAIHAGRDRLAVRLQVLDEGDGIPTGDLERLFDQFHLSCRDGRDQCSPGIELAVCRAYVEAMGGTISGYNRTDRSGAVFTITFPMAA